MIEATNDRVDVAVGQTEAGSVSEVMVAALLGLGWWEAAKGGGASVGATLGDDLGGDGVV